MALQTRIEKNGPRKARKSIFMHIKQTDLGTVLCVCASERILTDRDVPGGYSFEVREVCHSEQPGHVSEKDMEVIG